MRHFSLKNLIIRILLIFITQPGYNGVKITKLKLPLAVHNGTGPIELICGYRIGRHENGLVVKWFHDLEQIYQWIPPMPPQVNGIISGLTEYLPENTNKPLSHSIIRLKKVNLAMTGVYTCKISTILEDIAESRRMTVYVPDQKLNIYADYYNNTHINLTCVAKGARPSPILTIIVDGKQLDNRSIRIENYRNYPWIKQEAIVSNYSNPAIIQCEITIPGTGYRKREKLIYYYNKQLERNYNLQLRPSLIIAITNVFLTFIFSNG
ncbi:uncharacterized protein LOC123264106 [Cotesia glomerata]|uniref:Ig-like domain-containing protein n=1 Tax=Cotesia glomerata TaxID=32391 RepID=A0AAV7J775_COTGL|nr:uncharacterized protein LOC123264106 [Cotesia glomerata]KAH0567653.1 hypothetical protein KQX54_011332 [Cotesia glomerata]